MIPRVDLVIFDLDGTLIDSKQDLACAVNAARVHSGLPPLANETIYSYVGDGAPTLIRRVLGDRKRQGNEYRKRSRTFSRIIRST